MYRIAYAIGIALTLLIMGVVVFSGGDADAETQKLPAGLSAGVQRVEHLNIRLDTDRVVRLAPGITKDAGPYLSGEPDAALGWPFAGPDAAVWKPGADAAVWIPPDATAMGPRPEPDPNLSYICTSSDNKSCIAEDRYPDSCQGAFNIFADTTTMPIQFTPNKDGRVLWRGSSPTGTAYLDCVPVIPVDNRGR